MLVILGGKDNGEEVSSVEVVDINNHTITYCYLPALPKAVQSHQAVTLNYKPLYCGGFTGAGT